MSNLWKILTTHRGNGWWNLPQTPQSNTNPKNEGPLSISWLKKLWNLLSHGGVDHAGPAFYTIIAVFLAIVTLLELWIYTVKTLGAWLNPLLFLLSALKFVGVVAFFMHLRFDHKYFTIIFTFCMILGISVFISLLLLWSFAGLKP